MSDLMYPADAMQQATATIRQLRAELDVERGLRAFAIQQHERQEADWAAEHERAEAWTERAAQAQLEAETARVLLARTLPFILHDELCEANLVQGEACNCGMAEFRAEIKSLLAYPSTVAGGGAGPE